MFRVSRWRFLGVGAVAAVVVALGFAAGPVYASGGTPDLYAGPQPDGTGVTPVGQRVTPVGAQVQLGNLPTASALSPDGRLLLVLNAGERQSLQVIDTGTLKVAQTIDYGSGTAFCASACTPAGVHAGVAFSPDGTHAYASSAGTNTIHVYSVGNGQLTEDAPISLPAGRNWFPGGLAVTPDGATLIVADQLANSASVVDLATGQVTSVGVGSAPYDAAVSPDGRTAYITNQGGNTVSVLDISGASPTVLRTVQVGTHPNRMTVDPRTGALYVANSESDSVSVIPAGADQPAATISLAPYPGAPVGSNPDGLSLSPDGRTLYVANAGNNDVDVVDLLTGRVAGMVPTAWYPTAVTTSVNGELLYVVNGKGLGAGPNDGPGYIDPHVGGGYGTPSEYVGSMMMGSLSAIRTPDPGRLARYTGQVVTNDGFAQGNRVRNPVPGNPVPTRVGGSSPIKHVIYVFKENRSYDQMFGTLGQGNGDPALNQFGDDSAPNQRALERRFVTLDNYYSDAEVTAQAMSWAFGGNSNPYVEQSWPDGSNYTGRGHPYNFEGEGTAQLLTAPNTDPLNSYLWDRLAKKNISLRDYGIYAGDNTDPALANNSDNQFNGSSANCPDSSGTFTPRTTCTPRVDEWLREFNQYVANNDLPAVELLRLPNDHTNTTAAGSPTPDAFVADNDYAVGRLVDAVSHSKYWKSTAIFISEDEASDGPDHVDAHRTTAQVISPYTQTGKVDSTFYSNVSMLRTIELIVGLDPMTQFDAYATPMYNSFTSHPDFSTYTATKPSEAILTSVNGG